MLLFPVIEWGDNYAGQTNVPEGLKGVVAVSVGHDISLAIKSDRTVVAWVFNAVNP